MGTHVEIGGVAAVEAVGAEYLFRRSTVHAKQCVLLPQERIVGGEVAPYSAVVALDVQEEVVDIDRIDGVGECLCGHFTCEVSWKFAVGAAWFERVGQHAVVVSDSALASVVVLDDIVQVVRVERLRSLQWGGDRNRLPLVDLPVLIDSEAAVV
jgi:hypothetical protein